MEVEPLESINRIGKIMALLEAHPEGLTGRSLADGCGVSWGTMKQDLKVLAYSIENSFPLYTDHDEGIDGDEDDLFQPEAKWFMAAADKRYTPIYLNVREAVGVISTLDFLQEENDLKEGLRHKILSGFDIEEEESCRYIKGGLTPLEPIQSNTFHLIENAISKNKRLSLEFNGREIMVDPLGIVYYSRLRCWYLVARHGEIVKTYHLKNVQEVKVSNEPFIYPEGFSLKSWLGPRWGMEYGDLVRVKVRFLNRSQTVAKLHKDVAHRSSELTTLEDGSILLQDNIIGVNEFISWVLGFGSAAEIIEPVELRELILDRIQKTLENYKAEVS